MQSLKEKIERMLTAGTFAEVGEHETALGFLLESQTDNTVAAKTGNWRETTRSRTKTTAREKLEHHLMAAAFAEAGEFETAREMLPGYERKQTVLLAIEGTEPSPATFDYAVSLCRRVNAHMDILQMKSDWNSDGDGPSQALSALLPALEHEGISFSVTVRNARPNEILYDYVRIHRDVVTAVIDSPSLRNRETDGAYWTETLRSIAEKLCVPLVTASQRSAGISAG